jgi:heat shock protein HslJ
METICMKKPVLFTLVILALLMAACSGGRATPTAQSTAVPPTQLPTELTSEPTTEQASAPAQVNNADVQALTANPWMWIGFTDPNQQYSVENPESYTLTFQDDGTVNIKADCNNAIGSYTVDGSSIQIQVGPMTMAACPPESRSDDFVKYLGSAAIYFFKDGDLYLDLMADGGTMQFSPSSGSAGTDKFSALGINLDGEPFIGTLYLGGGEANWLNPALISTLGGNSEGNSIDASPLGAGCGFFIPPRPDVVINWEEQADVDTLRFFFLSMGDPSMVLVTPSGQVICNDDLNPLVLDPYIEIKNPEAGRYAVFMGNYEGDAIFPGFLVVTSMDLNPATLDLAQLFPRQIDPRGVPQPLPLDVLKIDSPDAVQPPNGKLSTSDLPFTQELTAGGDIGAFNVEQGNPLCTGFISAAPSFRFEWTGDAEQLVMFFESNVDTTLQVLAPDGAYYCDDDYHGSENINPWLKLAPSKGTYNVWVGSFSPDIQADGVLTITSDENATPTPLTSKDISN